MKVSYSRCHLVILLPLWWHNFEQTRVDQITKQLGSGILEIDEDLESLSAAEQPGERSSNHVLDREVCINLLLR